MSFNGSGFNASSFNGTQQQAGAATVLLDSWLRYIRSDNGVARTGVSVTVYNAVNRADPESVDNTVATLFEDVEGAAPLVNPITTGDDGKVLFYASPGFYHIFLDDGMGETAWIANQPVGTLKGQSDELVNIVAGALAGVQFTTADELISGLLAAYDFSALGNYTDDTAAAGGGVEIGSLYRTGSTIKTRIA